MTEISKLEYKIQTEKALKILQFKSLSRRQGFIFLILTLENKIFRKNCVHYIKRKQHSTYYRILDLKHIELMLRKYIYLSVFIQFTYISNIQMRILCQKSVS